MRFLPTTAVTDFAQYANLRAEARANDPAALEKTAKQFEALLLQQMLKSMRQASFGEDVMGGEQAQFYQDLFDQQLSVQLASGKGIGLAEVMVRQLQMSQRLQETPDPLSPLSVRERGGGEGTPVQASLALDETLSLTPRSAPTSPEGRGKRDSEFRPQSPQDFIQQLLPHAEKAAAKLGIPARVLVAQAALETGWGRHQIRHADGSASFNFFGIKADKAWEGERVHTRTQEYENGHFRRQSAQFRAYGSIEHAFDDYARFLQSNPRYAEALRHDGSARHFTVGLQKAGYATDPGYAQKILRIAYGPTMQVALAAKRTVSA